MSHSKVRLIKGIIHITAPYFSAGVLVRNSVVYKAAPIVKYMVGWSVERVMEYCQKKGWKVE